jgi:hypothetical protein
VPFTQAGIGATKIIPTSAPLKIWIHEAKDESNASKWNALISEWLVSLEDEEDKDEDQDQQTESEGEIPTTQEETSLEEEDEYTTNVFNFDKSEGTDIL